ncbi:MAG: SH3 domain-containing protein [Aureispira sp.]|nr:SH3 domain-containing protein [Aureispira sp.]
MSSNRRKRKNPEPPNKKKKSGLNNIEMIAIAVFCLAAILYAMTKCGGDPPPKKENTAIVIDSSATPTAQPTAEPESISDIIQNENNANEPIIARSLYVIVDSLKMRKKPDLGSGVVVYLNYGQEIHDQNDVTDFEQTIRISVDEVQTAPWVKVKTKEGLVGWVFAAGLQFYPIRTLESTNVVNDNANNN